MKVQLQEQTMRLRLDEAELAQLLAGDISPDLVQGYLLALSAPDSSAPGCQASPAP